MVPTVGTVYIYSECMWTLISRVHTIMDDVDAAIQALLHEYHHDARETHITTTAGAYLHRVGVLDTALLMTGEPRELDAEGQSRPIAGGFTEAMVKTRSHQEVNMELSQERDHKELYAFSKMPSLKSFADGEGSYVEALKQDNAFKNPKSYVNMLRVLGVEEHCSLLHGDLDNMGPEVQIPEGVLNESTSSDHQASRTSSGATGSDQHATRKWRYDAIYIMQSREWAHQR